MKTKLFGTKTKTTATDKFGSEYSKLDDAIIESVPDIRQNAELLGIDEKIRLFESEKKGITEQLRGVRNTPPGPLVPMPMVESDAKRLLDGAPPSSLAGPDDIDQRRNFQRQIKALECAIAILGSERLDLIAKLCSAACIELTPMAKARAEELFNAYEELARQLELSAQFYRLIHRRGIEQGRTPAFWTITNVDLSILNGANGLPGLDWYINSRKEFWGLKG